MDDDAVCQAARLTMFGVGGTPVRLQRAEEMLSGQRLDGRVLDQLATFVAAELEPDSDIHASAEYRREVGGVVARRAVEMALGQREGTRRAMTAKRTIQLTVNGRAYERAVEVRMTLADFLRDELNLTGTHLGCEHGICGACTILFDGEAVRSCLLLAVQADGANLMTVEGLAQGEELHPLQQAFHENHALQCGFCTPGFLMTAVAFLQETQNPTEAQVREAISGNICRCTGYAPIVQAILQARRGG